MDEDTINRLAKSVVKGIAYAENGGKVDIHNPQAGQSGEVKSIFQFTPATWKNYAGKVLGNPDAPLTADNETYVVNEKVKQWIKEGHTAGQIASMWNAGTGEPDAYKGKFSNGKTSIGKNKYGVKFDVPKYADSVMKYATQFYQADQSQEPPSTAKTTPVTNIPEVAQASQPTSVPQMNQKPNSAQGLLQALISKSS